MLSTPGNKVCLDGTDIDVGLPILDWRAASSIVLVLIDPDSCLTDPGYRRKRREGLDAIRNLKAFSRNGTPLWEAEMPQPADYYHAIVSVDLIEVDSFSGFRCRIDAQTGTIVTKRFMK